MVTFWPEAASQRIVIKIGLRVFLGPDLIKDF